MESQTLRITFRDQTTNEVSLFASPIDTKRAILILPAMGLRASYYKTFASELSLSAYHVFSLDWRGQGKSNIRPSRQVKHGYQTLIEDIGEVIDLMEKKFPYSQKFILGHSLGGQLGSLFASRYQGKIAGLILISASTVYYKGWQGLKRWQLWMGVNFFYPLSKLFGYFPGHKIGFGGKESMGVMRDWTYNGKKGTYKLHEDNFPYEEAMSKTALAVLAISLEGDEFAPKAAVSNLFRKFGEQSTIKHIHLSPKEFGIDRLNHYNWTKHPSYFIPLIKAWQPVLNT